jgi:hypothetical protein
VNTLAETGKIYVAQDTGKSWRYSGTVYTEIIASPGSTDSVTEGSTNLYFTEARVRSTVLTGLNTGSGGTVAATDSVLAAFGKLENRTALNDAKVSYSASTARTDLISDAVANDVTDKAPTQNAVYDALLTKSDTGHTHSGYMTVADSSATLVNDNGSAITQRQIVYVKSNGHVDLALADAVATCDAMLGVVNQASIDTGVGGLILIKRGQRVGGFASSTFTPGAPVFLSPTTAGGVTTTCPATVTQLIVLLGYAVSDTEFVFDPERAEEIAA